MIEPELASPALSDFAEAIAWYAERSVRALDGFDTELDRVMKDIASDPERFPRCDTRHRFATLRRYPYRVVYRDDRRPVVVVAIPHHSRGLTYWTSVDG